MMAGGTLDHNTIIGNVASGLRAQLAAAGPVACSLRPSRWSPAPRPCTRTWWRPGRRVRPERRRARAGDRGRGACALDPRVRSRPQARRLSADPEPQAVRAGGAGGDPGQRLRARGRELALPHRAGPGCAAEFAVADAAIAWPKSTKARRSPTRRGARRRAPARRAADEGGWRWRSTPTSPAGSRWSPAPRAGSAGRSRWCSPRRVPTVAVNYRERAEPPQAVVREIEALGGRAVVAAGGRLGRRRGHAARRRGSRKSSGRSTSWSTTPGSRSPARSRS